MDIKRNNVLEAGFGVLGDEDKYQISIGIALGLARYGRWSVSIGEQITTTPVTSWIKDAELAASVKNISFSDFKRIDVESKSLAMGIAATIAEYKEFKTNKLDKLTTVITPYVENWIMNEGLKKRVVKFFALNITYKAMGYSNRLEDDDMITIQYISPDLMPDTPEEMLKEYLSEIRAKDA
jgi:hypothetical protein